MYKLNEQPISTILEEMDEQRKANGMFISQEK